MPGLLDLIAARNPEQAGGLLSDLTAGPRNRLRGLLDNPIGFANDALQEGLFGPPEVRAARDKFWNKEPMTEWEKQAYTNQLLNMGMAGLTVYHGSPHKFDKFDMSKIGSGEGAQAYGHGLYFAESPEVAVAYRNKLATDSSLLNPKVVTFKDGSQVDVGTSGWALNMLKKGNMDAQEARVAIETELKDAAYLKNYKAMEQAKSALKALDDGAFEISGVNAGQLYKVDIPDESIAKMLDWDKPLSQQAPEVQKVVQDKLAQLEKLRYANPVYSMQHKQLSRGDMTGQDLFRFLGDGGKGQKSMDMWKSAGIPGIRYLDGGSRNAGQGTYNYVVFDDTLPTILERNGQKLK